MSGVVIIIPAYNEEGKISRVVEKVRRAAVNWSFQTEILVVDDGSKDATTLEAVSAGAKVVRHERNLGVGAAIRTGLDWAIKNNVPVAVVISGDDQHEPMEIPRVVTPILDDVCEMVQGSRWLVGGKTPSISLFRWFSTRLYAVIFSLLVGHPVSDATNGFRAVRVKVLLKHRINLWQEWLNRYELEPYWLMIAFRRHLRIRQVPITIRYHPERTGWTKMKPIVDWWRLLRPILFIKLGLKK